MENYSSDNQPGASYSYGLPHWSMLQNGLLLEDRRILLPWGSRRFHLIGLCRPDRVLSNVSWEEISWNAPVVFGGLASLQVQVILYPYGYLDEAWIWLYRGDHHAPAREAFNRARGRLSGHWGTPINPQMHPQCTSFIDVVAWEWPEMRLGLFLREGEPGDNFSISAVAHIARRSEGCIPAPP